jgi:putative selenate reductase
LEEGVLLRELASPTRFVLEGGRVVALECVQNMLGEPGPDGRRRPTPIPGSEFQIEASSVIVAIGQTPDVAFLEGSGVSLRRNRTIDVEPETGLACGERVYAGGDAVRGPATIIEACADGRRAAEAICRQLGVPFERPSVELPTLSEEEIVQLKRARARREGQNRAAALPLEERGGFDLVDFTLTEEATLAEAARCLQCSAFCDKCVEVCPNRANLSFAISPLSLPLPVVACRDGALAVTGEELFCVAQGRQILHVDDLCNACGNCATFCVHDGQPYLDKPRLFLSARDFEGEEDNAFHVERNGAAGWAIRRREGGEESRLTVGDDGGGMVFENRWLRVALSPGFQVESMELKEPFEGAFSLAGAAEMALILRGIEGSLHFLLSQRI